MLASLLFGALYQGGAELAFEIPGFSRDMVFTLQGLIVLFSGAMAQVAAPTLARAVAAALRAARRAGRSARAWMKSLVGTLIASTLRVSTPLILCALAGALSERSGVIDLGLEGKMLLTAFAAGAAAAASGSLALALAAALAVGVALSMLHGYACVSHRGDQVVMGMAITMTAAGLTVVLGIAWFAAGRPDAAAARRGAAGTAGSPAPATRCASCPGVGPVLGIGLLGHNALVYVALALVAGGLVAAVPHALRPAPARRRREPGDGRRRRRLGAARCATGRSRSNGVLCALAGSYLVLAQNPSLHPAT